MEIRFTNGQVLNLSLENEPTIAFDDGKITLNYTTYMIGDISKYSFKDSSNALSSITNDKGLLSFSADGLIVIAGNDTYTVPMVYDMSGRQVSARVKASNDGTYTLDIRHLASDHYIITIGDTSFKIYKK